jgi:hypothetical protein
MFTSQITNVRRLPVERLRNNKCLKSDVLTIVKRSEGGRQGKDDGSRI